MIDKQIVDHVKRLFEPTVSPGQAFDSLFALRQARVAYQEVFNAILRSGGALDEDAEEPSPKAKEFQCPGCGVARASKAYCINPECPEYRANPTTATIMREQGQRAERMPRDPKFKNPVPSFGKYRPSKDFTRGLTLLEIADKDPAYLKWMAEEHESAFWREQAKMAQVAAEVQAPPWKDTAATGFFDG